VEHPFIGEGSGWYINLPEFLQQGGSKGDLQMVCGADVMLQIIAGTDPKVWLQINTMPFPGADELCLLELCDTMMGSGTYHKKSFRGKEIKMYIYLFEVTRYVFYSITLRIFIK
jgi:hypothetical protein